MKKVKNNINITLNKYKNKAKVLAHYCLKHKKQLLFLCGISLVLSIFTILPYLNLLITFFTICLIEFIAGSLLLHLNWKQLLLLILFAYIFAFIFSISHRTDFAENAGDVAYAGLIVVVFLLIKEVMPKK